MVIGDLTPIMMLIYDNLVLDKIHNASPSKDEC